MNWGSILKLGGKAGLGFLTGGASLALPGVGAGSMMGDVGSVLGGASKGAAEGNNNRDNRALQQASLQTSRDRFALDAPNTRRRDMLKAAIGKNASPSHIQWGGPGSGLRGEIPQRTGGASSMFAALKDPSMAKMNDTVMQDELAAQLRGGESGGKMDRNLQLPDNYGKTSLLQKILGGAAFGTSLLGAITKSRGDGGDNMDAYNAGM